MPTFGEPKKTFVRACFLSAALLLSVLFAGCERVKTLRSSIHLPGKKSTQKSAVQPAGKSQVLPGADIAAALVGGWQFDAQAGSPEQMAIFKDGHVVFFYPSGNVDDTRLIRDEVRQPEYGPDMVMKLISVNNEMIVGQIGTLDSTANAVYSSRAKIWRRISAEPMTERMGEGAATAGRSPQATPRNERPSMAKTPRDLVGHWQALQGKPGEEDQLALFEDGRVLYYKAASQQVIDSHYVGGVFRIENWLMTAIPYGSGASNVITLSFDQNGQISGIALVWRRLSDQPKTERMPADPAKK